MNIPTFLPRAAQQFYTDVYNKSYSRHKNDVLASEVAWNMVKSRLQRVEGKLICNSENFEVPTVYTFALEPAGEVLIKNHDNGEIELDAVIATTEPRNSDGKYFTEVELQQIADQINTEGSTFPDVEHEKLQAIVQEHWPNTERILAEMKRQKGVFKTIKAVVQKVGDTAKLWVKAFLDKRYKNHVESFKKTSIEVLARDGENGRLLKPRYVGFTFTHTPQLSGADIAVA